MKKLKLRKIKKYELIFIVVIFVILITLLITKNNRTYKVHCKNAVCNESKTICYNYDIDEFGNTYKSWSGSCAKK